MDNQQSNPTPQQSNDPGMVLPPVQHDDAQPPQAPPPLPVDSPAVLAPEEPAAQTVPPSRALVPTPSEAMDGDLIEKEWVEKAKQIVEHTAEDPFNQQEALNKMKADYMKKRYNKDLGES